MLYDHHATSRFAFDFAFLSSRLRLEGGTWVHFEGLELIRWQSAFPAIGGWGQGTSAALLRP